MCKKVWCRDTRHFYLDNDKTAERNLCRDINKVCRNTNQEQAQRKGRDKKTKATTEEATKTGGSVTTELSMSRQRD